MRYFLCCSMPYLFCSLFIFWFDALCAINLLKQNKILIFLFVQIYHWFLLNSRSFVLVVLLSVLSCQRDLFLSLYLIQFLHLLIDHLFCGAVYCFY